MAGRNSTSNPNAPLIEVREVSKSFPGVKALNNVNISVRRGEVHAICGENGAGKSTLMKILAGYYPIESYTGSVWIENQPVQFKNTVESSRAGIAIVYQELSLIPNLSVAENVFLGHELSIFGWLRRADIRSETKKLLASLGLSISVETLVSQLGIGEMQLIEIAKALVHRPKILILDEPTSALSHTEIKILMALLARLKNQGVSVILISHKLDEVFAIADRVTVLRDGSTIQTLNILDTNESQIISLMVGREIQDLYPKSKHVVTKGTPAFAIRNLSAPHPTLPGRKRLDDVSFHVQPGEVLGIAGLMGAGRSETVMAIFGSLTSATFGSIEIDGKRCQIRSPADAISRGLAFASEDRKRYGLVLDSPVRINMSLSSLTSLSDWGFIRDHDEKKSCQSYVSKLKVKTPSLEAQIRNLSGGNQQKVILGKCLMAKPRVLFLDEPTRGIDIGAKQEIYQLISDLAKEGLAIVLVSSELPEILGLSDRILVMCEGRITGELSRHETSNEATQEKIMTFATLFNKTKTKPEIRSQNSPPARELHA